MQEIIQFLIKNPDVLERVKNGLASLVGVSYEEVAAILNVFTNSGITRVELWR
ncbi:competence pheromone ComX [Anaerobacillus alkalidiazotrophicus]|uniref:competence pheromone ComX n=1 Tax=Anaerobacillus alkalidiazotrophicus TaxID=472963 RepID=UPI000A002A7F|nr:competence pheromone ComX [Anaerobacillus alkalidiazotrophicus]